jgi:predicted Zn-dependent protease with MMP-like domain
VTDAERDMFDVLLEQVIEDMPKGALDEMPLIDNDTPSDELLAVLNLQESEHDAICGAFQKFPRRKKSMLTPFRPETPSQVFLFREGVVRKAGGWAPDDSDTRIVEQIRETVREQLAHRFKKEKDESKHWRAF